jgi:RNA polymerase sigma-70 factor, ECF subfamily
MPPSLSEPALIDRARAGDMEAFEALVEVHSARVYGALHGFGLDPDEAEEVTQEVFLQAWRGLGRFDGRAQLSTWLYRIAFNEAKRRLSRRPPPPGPPGPSGDDPVLALDAAHDGPPAQALDQEFVTKLGEVLAQLPEEWRTAVVLRDIEGLSTEDAAAVVGLRAAAFKSRLHRGRMELRTLLETCLDLDISGGDSPEPFF